MSNSKVKVAVRVRPLNEREEGLKSECVVRVSGNQITLLPPFSCKERERKEPHSFTFDNCFWTEEKHDTGQEEVFRHLGDGVLENIWLGYNVCIFAYGQTGSGKTFSMMGTDDQPGVVPRICSALFEKESSDSETFRIEASYLEIYNEEVRDLLRSAKKQKKLRVRENKLLGPYVEDLSCHAVQSYEEIKLLLDQGNKQRAIAETKMNEQSSRSHAILTLTVAQTCNDSKSGAFRELVSKVSLVDLAGSERSYRSGAQGSQLKETSNINKSLSTLGLVINSLAEISGKKRKSQYVNYRDSVLTRLLETSLGGNSKTVMLATVSPAADNYQETLSTLRYADSAKRIVNQAVVNEDVKTKAIEELQQAIKRLREQLTTTERMKEEEVQELKSQLEEKENLLRDLKTSWEEKLKRTEIATQEWQKNSENMGVILNTQDATFSNQCYLIQQDKQLIIHNIKATTNIGSGPSQDIQISGAEADCEHCVIRKTDDGEVFLIPVDNCQTYINSFLSKTMTQLWHGDKIQIGSNEFSLYLPKSPKPEHMKTNDSTEAEAQTYDDLNTEDDMLSILPKRDSWNSSRIEDEKAKMDSATSTNYTTTEGLIQTIPSSNDDFSSSKNKQISHISTQMCKESYRHFINVNVNTARNTQSEYLGIAAGTQVQDSTVQCSPQYGDASSQTSESLKSSSHIQNTSELEYHTTLPRDTGSGDEPGERQMIIFFLDTNFDVSPLVILLMQCPGRMSLFPCTPDCKTEWKSQVDRSSDIFLCLSLKTPWPDLSDLEEFLEYCREKQNAENIKVVIMYVEDIQSERKITDWWMAGKYSDYELLALSKAEMRLLIDHKINLLSPERRMANKVRHMHHILQEAEEKSRIQKWQFVGRIAPSLILYNLGVTSSSAESDYCWMTELLHSDDFKDHFSEVMKDNMTNDKSRKFSSVNCSFGILYYTNKNGQKNEIDATDVELIQQHSSVGKNNMIIVMDGVEGSSDQEKIRILRHLPNMEELRHNLFLISCQEKSSKYQNLLSSLIRINKPQQPANVVKTEPQIDLGEAKPNVMSNLRDKFQGKSLKTSWNWLVSSFGVLGIFSCSSKEEYSWLEAMLRPQFTEVKSFYISNNRFRQFTEEVSQCRFGILYHSKNRGRINVTDVTGSIYDEELEYMSTKLGKKKVWVVIDDVDDNSEGVKKEILRNQPKIQNLAQDLYLIKHGTSEKKMRDLERNEDLFTSGMCH